MEEKKSSLFKTTCTALVLAPLAIFLGLIFSTRSFVSSLEGNPIWPYLAICLPLGVLFVIIATLGMIFFSRENKPNSRLILFIIGLVSGMLLGLSSLVMFITLKDITLGICSIGIGLCLIIISILEKN